MFSIDNIQSIRFSNPQNDTVEVVYFDKNNKENPFVKYWFPVIPYNSAEWKIVREAGYDLDSIYRETLNWLEQIRETNYQKPVSDQNIFTKLDHSAIIQNGKFKVTVPAVTDSQEMNLFITKYNNPSKLIKTVRLELNSRQDFYTFDYDSTDDNFSVYMVN